MKSSNQWLGRPIAVLLILVMAIPASHMGSATAQQVSQTNAGATTAANGTSTSPEIASAAESALPDNPDPAPQQSPSQNGQAPAPQPGSTPAQDNSHKPVGTAAAPYEPTSGIAGSRPAGAAIAPAKQRRVRTIVISLAVVAGAAIAVGSVAALSHGSPSRP